MEFELNDEQQVLQDTVRDFCRAEIVPHAAAWDREARFPHEVIGPMAELGLFGMQVPERLGGAGMGTMDYVVAIEEIAAADASVGLTMASHNSLCTGHILQAGSDAQKEKYLPKLASGEVLGAWGLTEPESGSDAGAARTRAVRESSPTGVSQWRINGSKTFITQGSVAGVYVVLASTEPEKKQKGLTAFVFEKGEQGFSVGRKLEKMGLNASDTSELLMEDMLLGDDHRLGALNAGFTDTLKILDKGRISIGAWALGIGKAAYEAAKNYAQERVQFGKSLSNFQAIQHMLADMATELKAARLLIYRAAAATDRGDNAKLDSSVAKYYAARAANRACNAALQIHGGYGYTKEFVVERLLRDVRLAEIGEGTNEIQKIVIARELLSQVPR